MHKLATESLQMFLHVPGDGFYQGTRFDHGGVWDSLLYKGVELCGRWFSTYDPFMHDAVCGPAEEFTPVFLEGGRILKVGVGLLQADDAPYDRFHLYPVLDGGQWTVEAHASQVRFFHRLPGFYEYEKTVALTGEASFEIRHALKGCYQGQVYNHNFFTMGKMAVGPSRLIDFPFEPAGTWRAQYDCVDFSASGVRFSRMLRPQESVYCRNIHSSQQADGTSPSASYDWPKSAEGDVPSAQFTGMPYAMTLRETRPEGIGPLSVQISGSVPVTHTVLWANNRIACLEPYNSLSIGPSETARWTLRYGIQVTDN